jgi:hypothetical protein
VEKAEKAQDHVEVELSAEELEQIKNEAQQELNNENPPEQKS